MPVTRGQFARRSAGFAARATRQNSSRPNMNTTAPPATPQPSATAANNPPLVNGVTPSTVNTPQDTNNTNQPPPIVISSASPIPTGTAQTPNGILPGPATQAANPLGTTQTPDMNPPGPRRSPARPPITRRFSSLSPPGGTSAWTYSSPPLFTPRPQGAGQIPPIDYTLGPNGGPQQTADDHADYYAGFGSPPTPTPPPVVAGHNVQPLMRSVEWQLAGRDINCHTFSIHHCVLGRTARLPWVGDGTINADIQDGAATNNVPDTHPPGQGNETTGGGPEILLCNDGGEGCEMLSVRGLEESTCEMTERDGQPSSKRQKRHA